MERKIISQRIVAPLGDLRDRKVPGRLSAGVRPPPADSYWRGSVGAWQEGDSQVGGIGGL